ncbi:MAG: peptidyl-prolyl cis-trans isomerase B (cyclophilin B) [Clostridium sp.]|jgi:peptidyl-prolyl cis-trans isomerase B (cyclophilin B)
MNPIVTINMENGKVIKAELYPDVALNTVKNFISLINKGFYNGIVFHRVIPGFMIQGGCPEGTGVGGPGYSIKGEFSSNKFKNDLKHSTGVLSMARSNDSNSAGSQFFLMVADSPHLDGSYAGFGKVTEGMQHALDMAKVDRDFRDKPKQEQKIKSMTVDCFGIEYSEPEKM